MVGTTVAFAANAHAVIANHPYCFTPLTIIVAVAMLSVALTFKIDFGW